MSSWAKMLSVAPSKASQALQQLVEMNLAVKSGTTRKPSVAPLLEDGSGDPYFRPGRDRDTVGPGYLIIPRAFWIDGVVDRVRLPGLAMLLIGLAETGQKERFTLSVDRVHEWYGFSERTAERGYNELLRLNIMYAHRQIVIDARTASGLRNVYHRELAGHFSFSERADLREATRREIQAGSGGGVHISSPELHRVERRGR